MWKIANFTKLTPRQIYDMYKLRQKVFVLEQKHLYPELDDTDLNAIHLLNYQDDKLVSYARIFQEGHHVSFGKIVVDPEYRKIGLGNELISNILETSNQFFPNQSIEIHAENNAQNFYEQFGFTRVGDTKILNKTPHVKMVLNEDIS